MDLKAAAPLAIFYQPNGIRASIKATPSFNIMSEQKISPLLSLDRFQCWVEGLDHPECVACGPDGTTYAGGEAGQIYRISDEGNVQQIATTGGFILGLCLDADRNVYACDISKRQVLRITESGQVTTYSRGTPARPMFNPNYPVFDADGNLFVSDSGHWGKHDGCIYRIRPGGSTEVWSTTPTEFPNGLALSSDHKTLYVVVSELPGVVSLSVKPDGSAGQPQLVVSLPRTVPDGLAFDAQQNLYISCYAPDVIFRLSRAAKLDVVAEDWQRTVLASPTNLAFCGSDRRKLVVASLGRWHLARTDVSIPGQPLNYPRL